MFLDKEIEHLIDLALKEDLRDGDITSLTCIDDETHATFKVVLKQAGVLAGLPYFSLLFRRVDPRIRVDILVKEGSFQKAGAVLAQVAGPARGILSAERCALNLLQHSSGIATVTAAYVKKVAGTGCAILDTRKTLPGLRSLEKYAVRIGGGENHRFGLDDRFIIKTNHLALLSHHSPHPVLEAFQKVRNHHPKLPVEIEVDEEVRLEEALQTDAEVLILCRMTPDEVTRCVQKAKKSNKKIYIESSGSITLDTVRAYAETGVQAILIGALTHGAPPLDIGMKFT